MPSPMGCFSAGSSRSPSARGIMRSEVRRALVQRYIDNVVAVDRKMISKVFHVLRWMSRELERTITALLEEGTVHGMTVEGMEGLHLVSMRRPQQCGLI